MLPSKEYSPLYKIKKTLLLLRFVLGFPLSAENFEFSEFSFRPWIECPRFFLLLIFFFSPQFLFFSMAPDASRNVVGATQDYFTIALGYTALDIIIILWIPYVHLASTIFYTISFKNRTKEINQVCLEIIKVKTFLGDCFMEMNSKENKSNTRISLRLVVLAVLVALVTLLLYGFSIYLTMGAIESAFYITRTQMWILVINNAIQSVCWIYPFMSISADLMTCHILEDMGNIYLNWNNVLKIDLKKQDTAQTSLDHHFMLDEVDNSRSDRLISCGYFIILIMSDLGDINKMLKYEF